MQNRWVVAAVASVSLLGGLWAIGELIPERPAWEVSVMQWMADQRSSFFDDLNGTVTALGSPAFTFIALGIAAAWVLVWKRSPLWFGFILLCMLAPAVYDRMMKQLVERPRPNFSRALEVSGYGFPSGHATSASTVAGALFMLFLSTGPRKARPIVLVIAVAFLLAVGASRVYIGVHWPTDVLGGFVLGAGWVGICVWALDPLRQGPTT